MQASNIRSIIANMRRNGMAYEGGLRDLGILLDWAEQACARIETFEREDAETLAVVQPYLQAAIANGHARGFGTIQDHGDEAW